MDMKVSCVYWDADSKQFDYMRELINVSEMKKSRNMLFSHYHATRQLERADYDVEMAYAKEVCDGYNRMLKVPVSEDEDSIVICRDCSEPFYLDRHTKHWYSNKGLKMPCRCESCRSLRRKKREEENNA